MFEFYVRGGPTVVRDLPYMARVTALSSQWPFVIRCHPDKWELAPDGKSWRLEISKVSLRPGVGGVAGRPGKDALEWLNIDGLRDHWRKKIPGHSDGQWMIIESGAAGRPDPVMAKAYPDGEVKGAYIRRVQIRTEDGKTPYVFFARWEKITQAGGLADDDAELKRVGDVLAKELFGLDGPTELAKLQVVSKLRKALEQVETSARGTPTPERAKRAAKLRAKLAFATGESSWTAGDSADDKPQEAELAVILRKLGGVDGLKRLLAATENTNA